MEFAGVATILDFSDCNVSVKSFVGFSSVESISSSSLTVEVLYILRCFRDIIPYSCEMQLFYSSTGLIDLSAHPAHPFCCGGTLLFALDVLLHAMAMCNWVCLLVANFLHIYFDVFSIQCDVSIFAGHHCLVAFCNIHLTSGGLSSSDSWT